MVASAAEVLDLLDPDSGLFIPSLKIVSDVGERRFLNEPWEEQAEYLEWFYASLRGEAPMNAYVLKSRQMGISTVVVASLYMKAFLAPKSRPRSLLTIGHEEGACKRMIRMIRNFTTELPPTLRPSLTEDNKFSLQLGHNGSRWTSLMAGGRGQGRSDTYTDLHGTETAFWPRSSSASAGADTPADQDAWSSVASVIHDPGAHRIIESTANGPRGFFYDMHGVASTEDDWKYFFFPWTMQKRYRRAVPNKRQFLASLSPEEIKLFGGGAGACDLEQIAWRRYKLSVENYSLTRFRREYPLTELEPFLVDSGGWFNGEAINDLMQSCPSVVMWDRSKWDENYTEWIAPEAGRLYSMGIDTCGGTGGDYCIIYVLRDDYVPVAKFKSNRHSPKQQAYHASRIGARYGKPRCLVECNHFGLQVAEELQRLGGVRMWKPGGKWFYTTGRTSGDSKRKIYSWARYLIEELIATHYCKVTLKQLQRIVERVSGTIAPPSDDEHDDDADGWVLSAFACKLVAREMERRDPAMQRADAIKRFKELNGIPT